MKKIEHFLEATPLWIAMQIFRLLGPDTASALGGWIGRTVGPKLGASRKADKSLKYAFPMMSETERKKIITEMWDNLGRVMAEYPHLQYITENRVEVVGEHHVDAIGKDSPSVVMSSHLANWELGPFYFNYKKQWPLVGVYRAPNNPFSGAILQKARNPEKRGTYVPKSSQGARDMVKALRRGERLGILIDQRYNEGIAVPFFGKPAMTSPSFAQFAQRYNVPVLPLQVERLKGCNFRITLHPPFKTEGRSEEEMVAYAHGLLEDWILQNPGQWLWLHRRWKSDALKHIS
ncbi:MAG: hypothetical protein DI626_10475 [Micavibrio aeruginosavorus]|uniref:Lauroyl acyltransferase n=1 Tax=Micavibrio aeruginosavorus TaxID=349221 RepID=A0A2W4ZP84_9BACT|nr:MAG: hypothetical protein DI626_10475 [Micavibrio aeruginosavorus]